MENNLPIDIKILNPPQNIIFLDVDGVLNNQLFYERNFKHLQQYNKIPLYKTVKKLLKKLVKKKEIGRLEYYKSQIDIDSMELLNELCAETNSAVVLSASMRGSWDVLTLNRIFQYCGATFTIIDKTGHSDCRLRGVEIHQWLKEFSEKWFGLPYHQFNNYVILDDDSDILLWQQHNFFHVDRYVGLTPNICWKIKRFLKYKV